MRKKLGVVGCCIVVLLVGAVIVRWDWIQAKFAVYQFAQAETDDARQQCLSTLLNSGDGAKELLPMLQSGTPEQCHAIATALADRLAESGENDPIRPLTLAYLQAHSDSFSTASKEACLVLVPALMKASHSGAMECGRELVKYNLGGDAASKTRAVRLAALPGMGLQIAVVPLLDDADAGVRQAAMTVVGPSKLLGPEELFRHLNDADETVKMLCEASLGAQGLEAKQIDAGRKLTSQHAGDRLALVFDLHRERNDSGDVGPWLERLSRDADPAVRAAVARVGYECRLQFAPWLDALADDADATVARIARYHRQAKVR